MTIGLGTSLRSSLGEELRGGHFGHLAADAFAQHLLGQRRLQIDDQLHAAAPSIRHRPHRGSCAAPRHPRCRAPRNPVRRTPRARPRRRSTAPPARCAQQAPHVRHLGMRGHERRERRTHRLDRVAQVGGEGISVARRSGAGRETPPVATITRGHSSRRSKPRLLT